jgi:hypothetical protein
VFCQSYSWKRPPIAANANITLEVRGRPGSAGFVGYPGSARFAIRVIERLLNGVTLPSNKRLNLLSSGVLDLSLSRLTKLLIVPKVPHHLTKLLITQSALHCIAFGRTKQVHSCLPHRRLLLPLTCLFSFSLTRDPQIYDDESVIVYLCSRDHE